MDQETIRVYDQRSADYAKLFKTGKPSGSLRRFAAEISPGGRVLDLGCGPGTASAWLVESGFSVTALDASEGMIEMVRRIEGVEVVWADFEWLVGQSERFDGIWANFALLHAAADRFEVYLDAVAEALRPGGVFHLGMKTGEGQSRDRLGRHYLYRSRAVLERLLTDRGFRLLRVKEGEEVGLSGGLDPFVVILAKA